MDSLDQSQSTQIPDFITDDEVETTFKALDKMIIKLVDDPTVLGPSYIHGKLRECREASNDIEKLLINFLDKERRIKNLLAAQKEIFKAMRSDLIALDEWVLKGKSASDREARVEIRLKNQSEILADLNEQSLNVSYVLRGVELKRDGLNRLNNDIKKQVALMEFTKSKTYPLSDDEDEIPVRPFLEDKAEDIEDLFSSLPKAEKAPDIINPSLEKHLNTDFEPHENLKDDIDSFLINLTIEESTLTEKVLDDGDEEIDSDLFSFETPTVSKKQFSMDSEVVDIGKFLSQG